MRSSSPLIHTFLGMGWELWDFGVVLTPLHSLLSLIPALGCAVLISRSYNQDVHPGKSAALPPQGPFSSHILFFPTACYSQKSLAVVPSNPWVLFPEILGFYS